MPNVKVLLNENIEKLGDIGEIVAVKPGYARNYLIPEGKASLPTLGEVRRIKKKKELLEKVYKEEKAKAEEVIKKIEKLGDIVFSTKAGESGKIFGSISNKDIAEKLHELTGEVIDRKQVQLKRAITSIGEQLVKIKLHHEVFCEVKVVVKADVVEKETFEEEDKEDSK